MLQQTRVETVIPYYARWLAAFPDPAALAAAPEERVLKLWEGLGYYSRARHLQEAARRVAAEHGGRLPSDPAAFRRLPGVGEYIAAAVLSIAFGVPEAVVDGNVVRVVSRLLADPADSSTPAFRRRVKALLEAGFHGEAPGEVNQAWMELGALVCRPRPACGVCPLAPWCRAHALGRETDFPVKPRRRPVPLKRGVILWLQQTAPSAGDATPGARRAPAAAAPCCWCAAPRAGCWAASGSCPTGCSRRAPRTRRAARPAPAWRPSAASAGSASWQTPAWRSATATATSPSSSGSGGPRLSSAGPPLADWVEQRWVSPAELAGYPRPRVHILAMERLGLLGPPAAERLTPRPGHHAAPAVLPHFRYYISSFPLIPLQMYS